MATLYTVGTRYDRVVTVAGFSSSDDGYIWSAPTEPFLKYQNAVGIATDGTTFIAISDDGYVTITTDKETWVNGTIINGNYTPRAITYGNISGTTPRFMLCGSQKYANDETAVSVHQLHDEVAQIFVSNTAPEASWIMTYSQDDNNSIFHGIRNFDDSVDGDIWVACGVAMGDPLLVYSLDYGYNWVPVSIPSVFNGRALFDITYVNEMYYVSAYGAVLSTPSLVTPIWQGTNFIPSGYASSDFTRIASNPAGHIVAVSSGMIFYSLDGVEWKSFLQPGYQFCSVIWYNDHWIVGTYGLMTKYTYFTSSDTVTWTGANNTLQMMDFAVVS